MNSSRRKKLNEAYNLISEVAEQEREAFDNLPESIQDSEKGETIYDNAEALDEILDSLRELTG